MSDKKLTAVQWFYDKIKSHFEHDGDLLETLTFTMEIAKEMEREQIVDAWNDGDYAYFYNIDGKKFEDGDEYYEEKFGGKDE
jgi:hypothetical protein